ncbi:MAG: beta-lactamase family protein [Actinobacteria bacterium]|nr:beta-lactamase family protein [Actinomycetota bacterium]
MIESLAEVARSTAFSGAVRVDRADVTLHASAHGLAQRAHAVPNTVDTQFGIASGMKGLTALTVLRLVDEGVLALHTTARSLLREDLPLIDDAVTVEHLLSHRSGIGDYLDESGDFDVTAYPMPVPVHRLLHTEDYLPVLDGHPQTFAPGERFEYCNGGFVVLALLVERATGEGFHEVVERCVIGPAALTGTAFLRNDMLPGSAATGYLDDTTPGWSNVLHLPVRGNGDGGVYTTVGDICRLWKAVVAGEVVAAATVQSMTSPRSSPATASGSYDYGLGCWLRNPRHTLEWEGYDAGQSFRSGHDRATGITYAVCANTSEGAWPIANEIARLIDDGTL